MKIVLLSALLLCSCVGSGEGLDASGRLILAEPDSAALEDNDEALLAEVGSAGQPSDKVEDVPREGQGGGADAALPGEQQATGTETPPHDRVGGDTIGTAAEDAQAEDAEISTTPRFTWIQDNIFSAICIKCHVGEEPPQGLNLEKGNSYSLLVNVPSIEVPDLMRVKPGDPDNSYIVIKEDDASPNADLRKGERMPRGLPALTTEQITAIRDWISAGAKND